jgi:hypothetical protein
VVLQSGSAIVCLCWPTVLSTCRELLSLRLCRRSKYLVGADDYMHHQHHHMRCHKYMTTSVYLQATGWCRTRKWCNIGIHTPCSAADIRTARMKSLLQISRMSRKSLAHCKSHTSTSSSRLTSYQVHTHSYYTSQSSAIPAHTIDNSVSLARILRNQSPRIVIGALLPARCLQASLHAAASSSNQRLVALLFLPSFFIVCFTI